MARLTLTLLGGFRACLDPGPPVALPTRKTQALLAYLAVPPGATHARGKLASLLWGNAVETTARTSLRHALYALRKRLRDADGKPLRVEGETVACDPAAVTVDVSEFERRALEGTPAALAEAAALYRGDLLEGLTVQEPPFEDWLLAQRERLHEMALVALNRLLAHLDAPESTEDAVQVALRLLALDPLQEPVHRALMRLYVHAGRRGAALRQYQIWVATLQRELRTEPDAETKALYQEILRRRAPVKVDVESRTAPDRTARSAPRRREVTEPPAAGEPSLVGRQQDLACLEEALDRTLAGQGQLVVLIGEAGSGKSRLVAELMARATRHQGRVLMGRCYETERILPFAPWVDALRTGQIKEERELLGSLEPGWRAELGRLLPELSSAAGAPASRPGGGPVGRAAGDARRLFEGIAELLTRLARRQPLVIVLEDLHWADEMSLRFLAFLGRRLPAVPILALATIREEDLADSALLRQTLDELDKGGRLLSMLLGPLSPADTAALVRVLAPAGIPDPLLADLATEAWRASDGNAFVVVEVMHALREGAVIPGAQHLPLPARVQQLVRQRLERLSERGRRLVAAAAVIGRRFDFPLLQRAAELSERETAEGVEEVVRHRVLRGAGEGLEFSHDYIREVASGELTPPIRVLLHRRVAESLEQLSGPVVQALALATHYRQGEVWDKATRYFREAGRQAAAHSAHHEAVACYEEALGALRRLPATHEAFGRELELHLDLRPSLYSLGRSAELVHHLREAERLAEVLDDRHRLGQVSAYVSNHAWLTGDLPRALQSGHRALMLAGTLGDLRLAVEANFRLGQVHWGLGRYPAAVSFFERCGTKPYGDERWDLPEWLAELGIAEFSLYWPALPLTELGRFDDALAAAQRALEFATRVDRPFALAGAFGSLGFAHLYQGRLADAAASLERGLDVCRRWEVSLHQPWLAGVLGYALALSGQVSSGLALLREAIDEAERAGRVASQTWRLAWLGEASLLAGRPDDASTWADRALEQSRQHGERGIEAWALRVQAEVASAQERRASAAARERYHAALTLAQTLEMRPLVAHCHLGLGQLYRRARDGVKAEASLRTATTMYREMDMRFWLQKAKSQLEPPTGAP
jgi:DNA-binding SARP family transcriptional activator/tetratricopeptide (TPR) repeat protein